MCEATYELLNKKLSHDWKSVMTKMYFTKQKLRCYITAMLIGIDIACVQIGEKMLKYLMHLYQCQRALHWHVNEPFTK